MVGSIKGILSMLFIADQKNKVGISININKRELLLLDYLWSIGIIYGYNKVSVGVYYVFLKYTKKGLLLESLVFSKYSVSLKLFKSNVSEKNNTLLVKTIVGICSEKDCIKKGVGGYVFAKI